jgi:hypothetical protein
MAARGILNAAETNEHARYRSIAASASRPALVALARVEHLPAKAFARSPHPHST